MSVWYLPKWMYEGPDRDREEFGRRVPARLWPEVVIGQGWLAEAAQILANPDGADRATVEARYAVLLAELQEEAAPSASLQAMAAQFVKVTARYGPLIFTGHDVADLPRTNNDLEQPFGGLRHQLRRITGQKNAPASLVVCGATRLPAAVASQLHPFTAAELASADLEQWRIVRKILCSHRAINAPKTSGISFG